MCCRSLCFILTMRCDGQESGSDAAFVADRVELLLKQAARFGLQTRAACLEYLGSHFRTALNALPRKADYQVQPPTSDWQGCPLHVVSGCSRLRGSICRGV